MKLTCSSENAIPNRYCPPALGNGDLSLLVDYAGGTTPREYCDNHIKSGLWRAGFRYDKPGFPLVPFGFFEHQIDNAGPVTNWTQTLHVTNAASESECSFRNGIRMRSYVYCHLRFNLIVIRKEIRGTDSFRMRYLFAPERTDSVPVTETKTAYQINTWSGIRGTVSFFSPDPAVTALHTGTEIILTSSAPAAVFYLAFDEEAETFARTHSEPEIEASHRAAWAEYWAESTVPADRLPEQVLKAARTSEYHLRISSTKWSIPTGIYPYHWEGRYFAFDEFFALEGLLAAGHLSTAKKIPQFRFSHLDAAKTRAYSYFGSKSPAARFVWETIEQPGIEGAPGGFWIEHIFHLAHIALGAWHCSQNGSDLEFLRETAYPLMRGCAEYYRIFSVDEKEKGRFVIGKCTDLERLGAARENPFMTTCGVIATFRAAAEAANLLHTDSGLRENWITLAEKLTQTLPQNDHTYLPYPGCTDKSIGLFSGIFPYGNLPVDDPKQRQGIQDFCASEQQFGNMYPVGKSLCTWYAGWKAVTFRRLGETETAKTVVRQMAEETGCFSEVFEIFETGHHPWFCTGEGILLQAVCEAWR